MAQRVRSDYEQLNQIERQFKAQMNYAANIMREIAKAANVLRNGDWVGRGATQFYHELDGDVLPTCTRLCEALSEAADTTRAVNQIMQQAEADAARALDWHGEGDATFLAQSGSQGAAISGLKSKPSGSGRAGDFPSQGSGTARLAGTDFFRNELGADDRAPISLADAPQAIQFPPELVAGTNQSWDKSINGESTREQGGIFVRNKKDGTFEFKPGPNDSEHTFEPNYEDKRRDESLIAVVHTHPYASGLTRVSFSGGDLASFINDPEHLQVVRSGEGVFAVLRTKEFDARLDRLDDDGKEELYAQMNADWDAAFARGQDTLPFALRAHRATTLVSKRYDLAYYKGSTNGRMMRVTP